MNFYIICVSRESRYVSVDMFELDICGGWSRSGHSWSGCHLHGEARMPRLLTSSEMVGFLRRATSNQQRYEDRYASLRTTRALCACHYDDLRNGFSCHLILNILIWQTSSYWWVIRVEDTIYIMVSKVWQSRSKTMRWRLRCGSATIYQLNFLKVWLITLMKVHGAEF